MTIRRITLESEFFWNQISVYTALLPSDVHEICRQIFDNMDCDGSQFIADRGGVPVWHRLSIQANALKDHEKKSLMDDVCLIGLHYLTQCHIYKLFDQVDSEFRFFLEHITPVHLILQYDSTYDRTSHV